MREMLCIGCGEIKQESEFSLNVCIYYRRDGSKTRYDYRKRKCKACKREEAKADYLAKRDAQPTDQPRLSNWLLGWMK